MSDDHNNRLSRPISSKDADPLRLVRQALEKLRFGGINLTVHEGKLVQMEVTEKHRFL